MFCPNCGEELPDGAGFCSKCGTDIREAGKSLPPGAGAAGTPQRPGTSGRNRKSGSKIPVILAAAAAVCVLIVCLVLVHGKRGAASNGVSLRELLEQIDQAEELVTKAGQEYNAVQAENDDYGKYYADKGDIMEEAASGLLELRDETTQITGLPADVEEAAAEYFDLVISAAKMPEEVCRFLSDYFGYGFDLQPQRSDYESSSAYWEAMDVWYQSVMEAFDAMEDVPLCLETEWGLYKENFSLLNRVYGKEMTAFELNDWLRLYSAGNLKDRFDLVDGIIFSKLIDRMAAEWDFATVQRTDAGNLAEELHAYAQLSAAEQERYEFEHAYRDKIMLQYSAEDTIYPSLYNTYNAFAIVEAGCLCGNRTITVEAEIPGFTEKYRQTIRLGTAYRSVYIRPAVLSGELDLSSARDAQLNISVYEKDGTTLIEAKTFPVTLKSRNDFEWYSDDYGIVTQDNILCFLTPEAKEITALKRTAIDEISAMSGGQMDSFPGYQEVLSDRNTVTYLQAAGVMRALNAWGVRYNMDSFSVSGSNQHIQLPSEVLNERSGLCIETSLVVASALQSAGMHTFLVFPPGHAQVAVETWTGSGNYFLIETTAVGDQSNSRAIFVNGANQLLNGYRPDGPITWYSQDEWAELLQNSIEYLIDCDDSTALGLTPFGQ